MTDIQGLISNTRIQEVTQGFAPETPRLANCNIGTSRVIPKDYLPPPGLMAQ
jgi:hypothetical protein